MAAHNDMGRRGEEAARNYLLSKGYRVRHVNWRSGHLELDIVAEQDGMLVIVEVKSRSSERYGAPQQAVTSAKRQRLLDAADAYIHANGWTGDTRFDIIALIPAGDTFRVEHIEDAFMA